MCYAYVLESLKSGKRYVGSTKLTPSERLKQHNQGSNNWTRSNKPFRIIHSEKLLNFREARKRENYLKTTSGRRLLDKLIKVK